MRLLLLLICGLTVGCGPGKHPVSGSVSYTDGTPVRTGRVVADRIDATGSTGGWGPIGPDGTFVIGSLTPSDGLDQGTYRVWLDGTEIRPDGERTAPVIDPVFTNPSTSGVSYQVPERTRWDIVVRKPPKATR